MGGELANAEIYIFPIPNKQDSFPTILIKRKSLSETQLIGNESSQLSD